MADIVPFPPAGPPPATPEHEALRETWRLAEDSVRTIRAILADTGNAEDLTDDQRWELQWQLEYLLAHVRPSAFPDMRLPADEYRSRRDRHMRALGLGRFIEPTP